ncbi:MAG: hypothetical protein JWQ09_2535 [Segetibacter sp.]|nr:hypothetical protein [Segetibacter sp.]
MGIWTFRRSTCVKVIKYSILCEDKEHLLFIQCLIKHHFNSIDITFKFDEAFYKRFKCNNNKDVLKSYAIQIERSSYLDPYNLDIVFVGIDYDSRRRENFNVELEKLYLALNPKAKEKAAIFFPVQAIEHWFLFIKRRNEGQASTKNLAEDIEKITRKQAKQLFQSEKTVSIEKMIDALISTADIEWLCNQSKSFNSFYIRLEKLLKNKR